MAHAIATRRILMPEHRRYGYLELLDVANLIHESGSQVGDQGGIQKRPLTGVGVSGCGYGK